MSTRSYIMIETDDGKHKGIYCHSDGYLTYNGAILVDHYKERAKVEELMGLGNLSSLCERINPDPDRPHSFDYRERQPGVCVAYGRDRGETGQEAKVISLKLIASDPWIEYVYIYTKDNKWKYFEGSNYKTENDFKDVEEELNNMFNDFGIIRPKGIYGFYDDYTIRIIRSEQQREKLKETIGETR